MGPGTHDFLPESNRVLPIKKVDKGGFYKVTMSLCCITR